MILRLLPLLFLILSILATGAPEPFVVESKVQQDLENAVSRLISREQFLVQVTADVQIVVERKLVEGETVSNSIPYDPEEVPPPTMPGFVPEPVTKQPKLPQQSRQIYKNVETPTLRSVHIHVNFDDQLPLATVTRARNLVEQYLGNNYKGLAKATYGQMPMLHPDKKRELASEQDLLLKKIQDWDKARGDKTPTLEEQAWKYGRWSALFLLTLIVLVQFFKPQINRFQHLYSGKIRNSHMNRGTQRDYAGPPVAAANDLIKAMATSSPEAGLTGGRKQLLERFLIRSEVFRAYYDKLSADHKRDLYACLEGPGYERLLDGLGLPLPANADHEPHNVDEFLSFHFRQFDELVKAVDWQDRQSFGFLQHLSNGQLQFLLNHVSAHAVAMMLRFLRPEQSAFVLDSLGKTRRFEVLSAVQTVITAPLHEIQRVEKEVRQIAEQMPNQFYGSKKEDVGFWGKILTEAKNQDEILDAMEKTNPEIYPNLKKYRFSLEDAATLPNNILQKVLGDVGNDELGQALATCKADVAEVILDALSEKRRKVLESQVATYRRSPPENLKAARASLTKKLREVMG